MKAFDFDNTIYDGECSLDFFMYCLKRKKSLIRYLPAVTAKALKYKTGRVSTDEVNEFVEFILNVFFDNCENLTEHVNSFWLINSKKLKPAILNMIGENDVIISASPRFLFDGINDKLKTKNIICTEIDMEKRKIAFLCYSENKVKAFCQHFGKASIDEFYTDNLNDTPMINIAQKAFLVKNCSIEQIK